MFLVPVVVEFLGHPVMAGESSLDAGTRTLLAAMNRNLGSKDVLHLVAGSSDPMDMAWILPAFVLGALALLRKRPLGYVLAGNLLSFGVVMSLAITAMSVAMAIRGFEVVVPQLVVFAVMLLADGGMLFLEFGYDQGRAVSRCLEECGYHDIVIKQDLAGLDRMAMAVNPPC